MLLFTPIIAAMMLSADFFAFIAIDIFDAAFAAYAMPTFSIFLPPRCPLTPCRAVSVFACRQR
jgi:hypothetical protein